MQLENNVLVRIDNNDIVNGQLIIPGHATTIGEEACVKCTDLTHLSIPDDVMIHDVAFACCINLKALVIPEGIVIGKHAFEGCVSLTQLNISSGITLEKCAFWRCSGLTQVIIHEDVNFDASAFMGCVNLKNIFVYSNDTTEIERVKNSLPQNLREICVAHPLYQEIESIRQEALGLFSYKPDVAHDHVTFFSSLPGASSLERDSRYYHEAKNKMRRQVMPEYSEDLASYKSGLDVIALTYLHKCKHDFVSNDEKAHDDKSQVCNIS
tara:strand:+ start:111 stop:911 length:801 start_codon:yes stop_codon:yes gene_type:complete